MRKIILCNFTVNNEKFIDPRYSITNDNEGNFYNILTSKMFYRKKTIVILVLIKKVLITINQLNQIFNFIQLIIQNYINLKEYIIIIL